MKNNYKTVAKAIRVEVNNDTDEFFLVFKITDSDFKKRIRDNWLEDSELELVEKNLVEKMEQ